MVARDHAAPRHIHQLYVDTANVSVAVPYIQTELGVGGATMGLILGGFRGRLRPVRQAQPGLCREPLRLEGRAGTALCLPILRVIIGLLGLAAF